MAFVSSFTPALARSSFFGKAAAAPACSAKAPATITMAAKSKSVPFLNKPEKTAGWAADAEFDPLGFSNAIDMKWLRESELKHGRICMLASVGLIVQELYTFGGSYFPKMLPVEAHDFYLKTGGMSQLLLFIAAFEALSYFAIVQMMKGGDRKPGQFYFDPLGLGKGDALKRYEVAEIKNGRLAMIGVGGIIHQQWLTHEGTIQQLTHFKSLAGN